MAHRVIVWGTGNVGKAALRAVVADPALALVAIVVSRASRDEHGDRGGGGNATAAARIVHAIPFVCAVPPGLLDALAVPLPVGRGLFRLGAPEPTRRHG